MKTYRGSCHCGAVKFTIKTDLEYSVRCDCSICRRHGAIMVRCDQNDLEIQAGKGQLTEYRFNTNVAIHYFCDRCGVYTFHKMRKLPDKCAINAGCIDDINLSALRPICIEGSRA
jgi:hypothetical protein